MRLITTSLSILMVAFASAQSPADMSCIPTDFTKKLDEFVLLNGLLDITEELDMVKNSMASFDPYEIKDNELTPISYSVLGTDFEITPFISSMVSTGLLGINPDKIEVIGPNMINIGISIPTELTANATVLFSITQTNKGLEQPCWTDLMNPDECNPLVVGLDLSAAFTNISFDANIEVDMLSCGPQAPEDCQDISVADLATMVINNQTFIAVATALKPMQYIEVTEMKVSFDQMTNFGYYIHDGGEFVNGIGNKILDISQEEVNKKGNLYTKITGHLSELMNDFINKQIQNKAQTLYGNSCY